MTLAFYMLLGIIPLFFAQQRFKATSALLSIAYLIPLLLMGLSIIPTLANAPVAWVPSMGIYFSFAFVGLSKLFLLLISGIGILIFAYALSYFYGYWDKLNRLIIFLQLFTISMIGLVGSQDLIILFLFWEMTTLTSYMLVKFDYDDPEARQAAFNGMFLTVLGGLAMLAGFIILNQIFDTWSLPTMIENVSHASAHPTMMAFAFVLILLGAITKSAQFPFQFWLTGAMKAPTPVSAFLHSATMVNAGVFMLAKVHPLFAENAYWYPSLLYIGLITCFVAGVSALLQKDLKAILACTTIYSLGLMLTLLASSDISILQALCAFIFIHALYKASLFMLAGILDKRHKTRDIDALRGAVRGHPALMIVTIVGCLSMAGVPPFFSFVLKNFIYDAKLASESFSWIITAIGLFSAGCISAVSFRFLFVLMSKNPHQIPYPKAMPMANYIPLALSISIVVATIVPNWIDRAYFVPATADILAQNVNAVNALLSWETMGWLSVSLIVVTLGIGVVLSIYHQIFQRVIYLTRFKKWTNSQFAFEHGLDGFLKFAKKLTIRTQERQLSSHLKVYFGVFVGLFILTMIFAPHHYLLPSISMMTAQISYAMLVTGIMITISLAIIIFSGQFLMIMFSFGVIGLSLSCIFLYYGALDVAMTQLLVEVLTVIIVVLAFKRTDMLKQLTACSEHKQLYNIIIAISCGLIVMFLLALIVYRPFDDFISQYFIEHSLPLAHGMNVVNIILDDFRSLDTFGEVIVVFGAAIAIWILFQAVQHNKTIFEFRYPNKKSLLSSVILSASVRIILQIMLVVSILLVLRGHNYPGGGFIGSLTAVAGVALYTLAYNLSSARFDQKAPILILIGMVLFTLSMTLPFVINAPIFTGMWTEIHLFDWTVKLGTPLLFVFGVYFVVLGSIAWLFAEIEDKQT